MGAAGVAPHARVPGGRVPSEHGAPGKFAGRVFPAPVERVRSPSPRDLAELSARALARFPSGPRYSCRRTPARSPPGPSPLRPRRRARSAWAAWTSASSTGRRPSSTRRSPHFSASQTSHTFPRGCVFSQLPPSAFSAFFRGGSRVFTDPHFLPDMRPQKVDTLAPEARFSRGAAA